MADDNKDGDLLTEEQALDAGPVVEAAEQPVIVPKKGKLIAEDGTMKVAIIRPCVSRGRRIRGLPPIYESAMLARNANVFSGWPMYQDHMPPELAKAMNKKGRGIADLGGRVVESWFDPELALSEDEKFGYKKGGVIGKVIPYKAVRAILEDDPQALHVSINAWPTSAKVGTAWGTKGMMIEGIRSEPTGSVDWVVRGGAGGRPLSEDIERWVSILESLYDPANGMDLTALKDLTDDQLREQITEHRPELAKLLSDDDTDAKPKSKPKAKSTAKPAAKPKADDGDDVTGLTESEVAKLIEDKQAEFRGELEEHDKQLEERAETKAQERIALYQRRDRVHKLIESASDLPPKAKADLKLSYDVTESGATPRLLVEAEVENGAEVKSAEDVLKEQVDGDIKHVREMIAEATGKPTVRGEGASGAGSGRSDGSNPYWRQYVPLQEDKDGNSDYFDVLEEAVA